ncbi:MAG: YceI family protein [Agriterribacter sp.]
MNNIARLLLIIVLPALAAFEIVRFETWHIKDDYAVKFSGKYASGSFKSLKGTVIFDAKHPEDAKFDVQIEVSSIETGNSLKNKHAQGEKWFNAEQYPLIRFTSQEVKKAGKGYEAKGELEIRGIKKPLTIPFAFEEKDGSGVFRGTFKVNRKDYGIGKTRGKSSDFTRLDVTVPVTAKQ